MPGYRIPLEKLLNTISSKKKCSWIYLGKDLRLCSDLEKIVERKADRINIGEDLQIFAELYRNDYVDFIGKLSLNNESPLWYLTSLSEKSPYISNFFLFCCYVKVCQKVIRDNDNDLIIIYENRAVLNAIQDNLGEEPDIVIISHDFKLLSYLESCIVFFTRVKKQCIFIIRTLIRIVFARIFSLIKMQSRRTNSDDPFIIMHSYADSRSFPAVGVYRESYLGNLSEEISKNTKNFFYLVDVLPTLWYPKAIFHLIHIKHQLYIIEEFLTVRDLLTALITIHTNFPKFIKSKRFANLNVRAILAHDLAHDWRDTRTIQCYLNFFISQRISHRFAVNTFLFMFENQIWEKAFCEGFKKASRTKLVAFAVVFINRLYTCFTISSYEKTVIPQPDVILVSGEQGKEMLLTSGFDPEKILVGGAIRYPDIGKEITHSWKPDEKTILIVLTGELNQSLELLYTSIKAFSNMTAIKVIIKCHPTIPINKLSRYLPPLPGHFHVIDKPIVDLLNSANLVVYTESSVSVEALALGIPILHVKSEYSIDINIFNGTDFVPSLGNPSDINQVAKEILEGKKLSTVPNKKVISQLFSPIDMQLIKKVIFQDSYEK